MKILILNKEEKCSMDVPFLPVQIVRKMYKYTYGPKKDGLTPGSLSSFAIQRTRMDFMFGNKNDLYEFSPQSAPKWATWVGVGVVDPEPGLFSWTGSGSGPSPTGLNISQ